MQFLKDKFEFIVVTIVLSILLLVWVQSGYNPEVKELLIAVFGAWLAVLRIVQKPSTVTANTVNADGITAENIESASTESGDIIGTTGTKITKE